MHLWENGVVWLFPPFSWVVWRSRLWLVEKGSCDRCRLGFSRLLGKQIFWWRFQKKKRRKLGWWHCDVYLRGWGKTMLREHKTYVIGGACLGSRRLFWYILHSLQKQMEIYCTCILRLLWINCLQKFWWFLVMLQITVQDMSSVDVWLSSSCFLARRWRGWSCLASSCYFFRNVHN